MKNQLLFSYADLLMKNGFNVYVHNKERYEKGEITWIHFVKDNKIGYCQEDRFGFLSFSSVHKPIRGSNMGSGLQIHDRIYEPQLHHAENCFIDLGWRNHTYYMNVVKYKSWEERCNMSIYGKEDVLLNPVKTVMGCKDTKLPFSQYLQVNDIVDECVKDYFIEVLPPVTCDASCIQMGEPYSHTEEGKPTYLTLEFINGFWRYSGIKIKQ